MIRCSLLALLALCACQAPKEHFKFSDVEIVDIDKTLHFQDTSPIGVYPTYGVSPWFLYTVPNMVAPNQRCRP